MPTCLGKASRDKDRETQQYMEQFAELMNILKCGESFSGASQSELEELISGLEPVCFDSGVDLVKEGEPGEFVWVLIEGELKVLMSDEEEINRISEPGEIFGEISAVSHSNATATVRSLGEVKVLAIPRQRLNQVMNKSQVLASSVLRSMAKYLGKR